MSAPVSWHAVPWRGVGATMRAEVLAGLLSTPRTLPPKYFYDDTGSRLFEEICATPEYYPTRTELSILQQHAPEIARALGPRVALIEYGSGAAVKVRLLLDALESPACYVPVDISRGQLTRIAAARRGEYPGLIVLPVAADYVQRFTVPVLPAGARRVAFFPGSTIGNLHPAEATAFLARVRALIGPRGAMVLGVDRRKDPGVLHAAYNDAAGVTARFNLNILSHINHALGADFDLDAFEHRAFFNDGASRIEMHLVSCRDQLVTIDGVRIPFRAGETIHTECSYKYDAASLAALVAPAGFQVRQEWTDDQRWFSEVLLEPIRHP